MFLVKLDVDSIRFQSVKDNLLVSCELTLGSLYLEVNSKNSNKEVAELTLKNGYGDLKIDYLLVTHKVIS